MYDFVGFLDDDPAKTRSTIEGIPVVGIIESLPELIVSANVGTVFIAIPSSDGPLIRKTVRLCKGHAVKIKIVPRLSEIIAGTVDLQQIRGIDAEDFLGRAVVKRDFEAAKPRMAGKVVAVFGAAGSIGSELCKQLLVMNPKKLVCVDCWENGVFHLDDNLHRFCAELPASSPVSIQCRIANIQNRARMRALFDEFQPDIVFHAAAYKHVPLMEFNPIEAVENNIMGSLNLLEETLIHQAESFVLISTDKAVNPTSVMGATKRVAEKLMHCYASQSSKTAFSAVRFGNVLGSSGSVLPTFRKQIRDGLVTVTHKDVLRYFMTVQEAVQLVVQCWLLSGGDEIFVLDMGTPVRVYDLAELMIRTAGFEPGNEVEIRITGLRPGEKLIEETLREVEATSATKNERIYIVSANEDFDHVSFKEHVSDMINACQSGTASNDWVKRRLRQIVPTYSPPVEK